MAGDINWCTGGFHRTAGAQCLGLAGGDTTEARAGLPVVVPLTGAGAHSRLTSQAYWRVEGKQVEHCYTACTTQTVTGHRWAQAQDPLHTRSQTWPRFVLIFDWLGQNITSISHSVLSVRRFPIALLCSCSCIYFPMSLLTTSFSKQ